MLTGAYGNEICLGEKIDHKNIDKINISFHCINNNIFILIDMI